MCGDWIVMVGTVYVFRFDEECRGQVQENLGKKGITCHPGKLPTR
jgi:hypothetical protein